MVKTARSPSHCPVTELMLWTYGCALTMWTQFELGEEYWLSLPQKIRISKLGKSHKTVTETRAENTSYEI